MRESSYGGTLGYYMEKIMLKIIMFLLMVVSGFGSVNAMEWVKSKLRYGSTPKSYEGYSAARKRWIPLETWYLDEMVKLPLQWPADKIEQQKLVNRSSEFAEKYEKAWDSQDHINIQVTLYLSTLKDSPENEAYRQRLLKQREVMKKALLEYRLLKIKESQEQEAESKKQRARL